MMQATHKERSALRVPLFPPGVINQNVPHLRTILPAKPKEKEAAVESMEVLSHKTRKLPPPGIAPSEMKKPSTSFEILFKFWTAKPSTGKLVVF